MRLTRRSSMRLASAGLMCSGLRVPGARAGVDVLVQRFTAGRPVREGRVSLKIDDVIDNGITVPVGLGVESPMTPGDHVQRLLLLAPENPFIRVAEFQFSPNSGTAAVATRIRLAGSQELLALAEMSDGTIWSGRKQVSVVAGGCG